MRRIQGIVLVAVVALAGACRTSTGGGNGPTAGDAANTLTVFAAASLTESFREIGDAFSKENGGATITFNFGGSQQLAQQLAQGAPADVFASANEKQMTAAVDVGRVERDTARAFVRNRLVVVVPKENPGHVASVEDLAKPGLKLVLAAKEVPVGQYGLEMFDRVEKGGESGFENAVLANVVSYEQDVKTVLTKVVLGEADAGVVYTSDVTPDAKDEVARVEVPEPFNVIASYPIAAVKDGAHADLAKRFVDYVRSPAGQKVLVAHGFVSTTSDATGVALVGGDGYRKELTLAELRADPKAIVAAAENGSLRSDVPSRGPGYSVKGLVKIEVS